MPNEGPSASRFSPEGRAARWLGLRRRLGKSDVFINQKQRQSAPVRNVALNPSPLAQVGDEKVKDLVAYQVIGMFAHHAQLRLVSEAVRLPGNREADVVPRVT